MYFPQKWPSIGRLDALLAKTLVQRHKRMENRPSDNLSFPERVRNLSVCFSPIHPTPQQRELETGPRGLACRCSDNELEPLQGLPHPSTSFQLYWTKRLATKHLYGRHSHHGWSPLSLLVERPVLIPSTRGNSSSCSFSMWSLTNRLQLPSLWRWLRTLLKVSGV